MSDGAISTHEFVRVIAQLREDMREGFRGINARLDPLTRDVGAHGRDLAVVKHTARALEARDDHHAQALAAMERAVADVRLRAKTGVVDSASESLSTRRIAAGVAAAGIAAAELVRWLVTSSRP